MKDSSSVGTVQHIVLAGNRCLLLSVLIAFLSVDTVYGAATPFSPDRGTSTQTRAPSRGQQRGAAGTGFERSTQVPRGGGTQPSAPGRPSARQQQPGRGRVGPITGGGAGASMSVGTGRSAGAGGFEAIKFNEIEWAEIDDKGLTIFKNEERDMELSAFLEIIALTTQWTVVKTTDANATITAWLNQIRVADALKILREYGLYYEYDQETNILLVMTIDEYFKRKYGHLEKKEIKVHYADLVDMQSVLTQLQSPDGMMITDPRTSSLIIMDTADNLKYMEETLASLDVELEPQLFQLQHIGPEDVLDDVELLLSERGIAQPDLRSNSLMVTDTVERQKRIADFIESIDKEQVTRSFTVNFADPADISDRLARLMPEESCVIEVDERTKQISLSSIPANILKAEKLIEIWDKRTKQVRLKAHILSVSTKVMKELGIDWKLFAEVGAGRQIVFQRGSEVLNPFTAPSPGSGQQAIMGIPQVAETPAAGMPVTGATGDDFSAVINYLLSDSSTEILSEPDVTVMDAEDARFEVSTEEPYVSGGALGRYAQTGGWVAQNVMFKPVGVILEVTPTISDDGNIELALAVEDSTAKRVTISSGQAEPIDVPVVTKTKADTIIQVYDGETIVIGGLRSHGRTESADRMPFLSSIPILGAAFRNTKEDLDRKELVIFITPAIVEMPSPARARAAQEYGDKIKKEIDKEQRKGLGFVEGGELRRRTELMDVLFGIAAVPLPAVDQE